MNDSITKKTILYKKRDVGQRLLATIDFFQSNIVIIFKTITKIGIPVLLICSYFMNKISNPFMFPGLADSGDSAYSLLVYWIAWVVAYLLGYSLLNAAMASMMNLSAEGRLSKKTKFSEMTHLLPFASGSFVITLIIVIVIAVPVAVGAFLQNPWLLLVIGLIILFLIPFFSLMPYPLYFENKGIANSISKGIKLGRSYWGTTFLVALISVALSALLGYFFTIFMYLFIAIKVGLASSGSTFLSELVGYLGAFFGSLNMLFTIPFTFVCMAFQYFGIREDQEGLSLKMKIDEFENL